MPDGKIPYGKTQLAFHIPDSYQLEWIAPAEIPPAPDPTLAVLQALDSSLGSFKWADMAHSKSVAIAINDKTRPVPLAILLPPLLQRLTQMGISDSAITLIIATGAHTAMRPAEFAGIVPPEILTRYHVVSHNCDNREDLKYLGMTTRGTPVWINRVFAQAEWRIAVGNLEPHQFMGFSGGVKSAVIGLGGRETITHNHSMMLDPRAKIANYDNNPVRQDIEEIGKIIDVHLALNSIINEAKSIVHVIAGEPLAVMQRGIPYVLELYQRRIAQPFDLVITSPGGHPKDINVYQAQKALAHATIVTKLGGTVILVAECPEGTGSKDFDQWMLGMTSYEQVLERFRHEGFRIGPHKAFQIARDASRERVLFVTELDPGMVKRILLTPSPSLGAALEIALRDLAPKARIGIMPYANATIPLLTADRLPPAVA